MYADKEQLKISIDRVARRMSDIGGGGLTEKCPISIINFDCWEWAQGVGLYGLYRYYEVTGRQDIFDQLTGWYDRQMERGIPDKNVNTCAPMLTMVLLYEKQPRAEYRRMIEEWAEWVMTRMLRTKDGGLQHMVSGHDNDGQLWIDTLFMTVLFLGRAGILLGRPDYVEESRRQFLVHIKYLYDKTTGLWFHGWDFHRNDNFAGALWGRGNCWYTVSVVEYIELAELSQGGVRTFLLDTLRAQAEALARLQAPDGMWHTLLDDPGSYVETSATAGFAYGLLRGVQKGYLDASFAEAAQRAVSAVLAQVDEEGTVQGVSYGTGVGTSLQSYRDVPICPMTYGQGLALLCLTAALEKK